MADDFQFIKETRKEKPINRKRLFRHMVETLMLAILFGAVASLTFVVLKPRLEQYFSPEEAPQVSFVEAEPEAEEHQEVQSNQRFHASLYHVLQTLFHPCHI